VNQNVILHNPASEIELPRMEKRLPEEVLTIQEMENLLSIPNVSDSLGVRDRAMLELFYSTGIRRMELCRLELADVNTGRGTLHVRLGKGKKDRMVPLGARTILWVERYLQETRPLLCLDTRTQALFLTGYGDAFNPDVVSRMVATWLRHRPQTAQGRHQGRATSLALAARPLFLRQGGAAALSNEVMPAQSTGKSSAPCSIPNHAD
jgi:integrase/recombinase XerD